MPENKTASGDRYLVLTTFICGAIIMVVELLGSRVIGPPFGVSLFVWTSLITVTLVSLALGYWIGGRVSDIKNSPAALFTIILVSGICLLFIPLIKGAIIEQTLKLGLRAGSLASSVILFGPPLFFLGMVAPYTVKLYMTDTEKVGKTVGWLYAISTCGSFLGTVLTGFLLIPNLGVNNIIYLSSLTLIAISAGYWLIFSRKPQFMLIALVPIGLLLVPKELPSIVRPDGTEVKMLINQDSAYGQIKVVDYKYGSNHLREFLLENMIQGAIDVNTGMSISRYTYYMEKLALSYRPDAKKALIIGLGSGIIPNRFLHDYGIQTDVVEINEGVVDAARKYFNYDPAIPTYVEDGRYFLKSGNTQYDIIILDAFAGDTPPSHLISLEAFQFIKKRLAQDGILLINFVGSNMEEDKIVPSSLYRTLKEVFPSVDVYLPGDYQTSTPGIYNISIVAGGAGIAPAGETAMAPVYNDFSDDVSGLLTRKASYEKGPLVFTDDFNPIDFHDLKARERFRYNIITSSDRGIVID